MPDVMDRARTPLLTLITQQALDEDYEVAARRRESQGLARHRPGPRRAALVATAVFGVLLSMAFLNTTRNEGVDSASRSALIQKIESRRAEVADLQAAIAALRTENTELSAQVTDLTDERQEALGELERLQVRTGFVPVTGPGLRVTVTPPGSDPLGVQDSDLAMLVDGLWSAGAEAIAVNGHRLTARSAIRISGTAIEVNSTGIGPPYIVLAVGPSSMWPNFIENSSGLAFVSLSREWGFTYDIESEDDLTLPAAPRRLRTLRTARDGSSDDPPGAQRGGTEP